MDDKTIKTLILASCFLLGSCSKDAQGLMDTFQDQTITIDENPSLGSVLGKVKEGLQGNYAFTIAQQQPPGALEINAFNGELYVADAVLFDYETHPEINATVKVGSVDGHTSVNINLALNNIDDLLFFLNDSREAYLATPNGQWVQVTAEEYETLASRITGAVRSGTSEVQYGYEGTVWDYDDATVGNQKTPTIPADHRLFAFKYYATKSNTEGTVVKIALADLSPAYASLSLPLPVHEVGHRHFVLKGGSEPALRALSLGMYASHGARIVTHPELDSQTLFSSGNVEIPDEFPPMENSIAQYQGLSTDIIQWD